MRSIISALFALVLMISFAIAPTMQAGDGTTNHYGDGLHRGDIDEWFRVHAPGETRLRSAVLEWIDPCKADNCWLTRGKVFLAMSQVDDDDVGAEQAIGPFHSTETPSGSHVTSEELKGWIGDWLAFHVEQAIIAQPPPIPELEPEPVPEPVPTPWWEEPEPILTIVETLQSQQLMCVWTNADGSCGRVTYDPTAPLITCHTMSNGLVECEQ